MKHTVTIEGYVSSLLAVKVTAQEVRRRLLTLHCEASSEEISAAYAT